MIGKDEIAQIVARPVITPAEALRILPLSRNALYSAIKSGEIDSLTVGKKKILIKTAPLRRKLGLDG
jgi:hypothetical protein